MEILGSIALVLTPTLLGLMAAGVIIGALAGVIPGLTGGIAIAVLLPFTFGMEPLPALLFLLAIYTGSTWGGAITAILINTPGSPASAVTAFDGYPMTQRGESSRAVGLSLGASMLGAAIGAVILIVAIQPIGRFTLQLHSSERFLVAFFGLSIIAALRAERPAKAYLAGLFGILLGTMGMGPTGAMRGTFGHPYLLDGIQFVPALIGIFMVPELFRLMKTRYITDGSATPQTSVRDVLRGVAEVLRHPWALLRSAVTGVLVGAVPAAGATVATIVSYNQAKGFARDSDAFGKGSVDGLIAAEGANSSSEAGAVATLFALGIPGGIGTAVLLGAMISVGWVPGPRLISQELATIRGILWGQVIQALLLLPLGVAVAYWAAKVIFVPNRVLVPAISVIVVAGTYAVRGNLWDLATLLFFGVIGAVMNRYQYPLIALILGLILGPMADAEFVRVTQRYDGDYSVFVTRPISLVMVLAIIAFQVAPFVRRRRRERQLQMSSVQNDNSNPSERDQADSPRP